MIRFVLLNLFYHLHHNKRKFFLQEGNSDCLVGKSLIQTKDSSLEYK